MGAATDHLAVLEDQDLVGIADGGDALPDDDHRASPAAITSARSAVRSRASVATSSAENASSKR